MAEDEKIEKKAYREALLRFRRSHQEELEKTIQVLKEIRDSVDTQRVTAKNKIDASVAIAKMLGAYTSDKSPTVQDKKEEAKLEPKGLSAEDEVLLEKLLN